MHLWELGVGAIAERLVVASAAHAEGFLLGFLGFEDDRLEIGALACMGAIAEGLVLGSSTGAIRVCLSFFQIHHHGGSSSDFGFVGAKRRRHG